MAARPFDIVVFGASGFTGGLVARHLLARVGDPARWALAGRNPSKLGALRRELEREDPRAAELGLITATSEDPASLIAMAQSSRVIINLVGPYRYQGEALIEACIEQGCHYLDLTGEGRWWQSIVERHDQRARERGVILIPSCGFESVPHDLGVLYTLERLPLGQPATIRAYVRAKGRSSGGTWASVLAELSSGAAWTLRHTPGHLHRIALPGRSGELVTSIAVPAPTIEPRIVARTAELLARELRYEEYFGLRPAALIGLGVGVLGVGALAQIGPTRRWLQARQPQGSGPSADVRARSWFRIDFLARAGGRDLHTFVRGGDPGYSETSKMVAEAAITIVEDREHLPTGGVLTPASGLGSRLTERLIAAGIEFGEVRP